MSEALTPHQANSRFRYLEPPFPLPGKCAVCGNVKRPVIDFCASVDLYGAILICITCVAEAYEVLVREAVVEVPQTINIEELRAENDRFNNEFVSCLANLTTLLDGYANFVLGGNEQLASAESENIVGLPEDSTPKQGRTNKATGNNAGNKGSSGISGSDSGGSVFGGI